MLQGAVPIAFVGVTDLDRALQFYRETLGLTLRHDEAPFALVFDCAGTMLRVTKVGVVPDPLADPVPGVTSFSRP